jgi:SOS response regulatory protein OraA/RecX
MGSKNHQPNILKAFNACGLEWCDFFEAWSAKDKEFRAELSRRRQERKNNRFMVKKGFSNRVRR